jgi:hypothetical protein
MARETLVRRLAYGLASCTLVLTSGWLAVPATAHELSGSLKTSSGMVATLSCYHEDDSTDPTELQYVGLTLTKARAKARAASMAVRIVAKDGRCLGYTLDLRISRVDFWVNRGHVIRAQRF